MPRVGFEPKITAFERAKRVHDLDSAATVVDASEVYYKYNTEQILLGKSNQGG
jgi:hypothetical protein